MDWSPKIASFHVGIIVAFIAVPLILAERKTKRKSFDAWDFLIMHGFALAVALPGLPLALYAVEKQLREFDRLREEEQASSP